MFHIIEEEINSVQPIQPGTAPNYNKGNPLWKLIGAYEGVELAAGLQHYLVNSRNYLLPFTNMSLYGPSGADWQVVDPRLQDNKNDFQKQNVSSFDLTETQIVRGYAHAGDWTGPFLRLSYSPGLNSKLSPNNGPYLGETIQLFLKVGMASTGASTIRVPYNLTTHRYEVELWGFQGPDLLAFLDVKGREAIGRGELLVRTDLIRGTMSDLAGPSFDGLRDRLKNEGKALEMFDHVPDHTMHPIRPLHIELAWGNETGDLWDSQGGMNYHYEFAMSLRGWGNYMGVGHSSNPHGGLGSLEYRNLYSNYFGYEARRQQELGDAWMSELGRELSAWNYDAYGRKPPPDQRELFMAVNYMDLHVLKPNSAIGLHRHRDSLEAFMLISGEKGEKASMVIGDWGKHDNRERAFEIRTMMKGDIVLLRGGQLHGLINDGDTNVELFMFGGYD